MVQNYPENIEEKLGFHRMLEWIRGYLLSELGRKQLDKVNFLRSAKTVQRLQQENAEFISMLEEEKPFPLDHYHDMLPVLERIRTEGSAFFPDELPLLQYSLETLKKISHFFNQQEEQRYPALRRIAGDIQLFPFLYENLRRILTKKGSIRDNASPELKHIRQGLLRQKQAVSGLGETLLRKAQHDGWVEKGVTLAMRGGRMVIPVPVTHKRRIPGIILDESATGKTVFVEPSEIVERNNEIKALEFAERREIERILTGLASIFRPYIDPLIQAYAALGTFDLIQAKARWAMETGALVPAVVDKPMADWHTVVHPLLERNLKAEGRRVVPLDIGLNPEQRILVISGPNAGGKSVCLQTVGLIQYMCQCGIPVTAGEGTVMGTFSRIFLDLGDEQSIDNDLSTYSSRLLNMKYFLKQAGPDSLVLMDEFGTGTEPQPGAAIAEVVLKRLNTTGTFGVITTHYTNLKHVAAAEEGMKNGAMLFDQQRLEPLFVLEIGKPGSSFAFEIARKMGLPDDLLHDAGERVGKEHVLFDKHLREILRDKRYWENKRQRIRQQEKKLAKILEKYDHDLGELSGMRKKIIEEARAEASALLDEVNKKIENTIRKIKEEQADKEKTKLARAGIEELKEKVADNIDPKKEKLEKRIREVRAKKQSVTPKYGKEEGKKDTKALPLTAGDKVRLKGQEIPGEILQISESSATVAFGDMVSTLNPERLERVSSEVYRSYYRNSTRAPDWTEKFRSKKLTFKPEIDVRGKRANEALQEVMDFIDEALIAGAPTVRILHGKGDGILRQLIRDYLHTVDLVSRYHDAHIEQGGSGITVVELS